MSNDNVVIVLTPVIIVVMMQVPGPLRRPTRPGCRGSGRRPRRPLIFITINTAILMTTVIIISSSSSSSSNMFKCIIIVVLSLFFL